MLLEGTAEWIVANDDGTGQFGDVWDTEWVRAAAASIDAVLQSATNPGITPAELIDEVVEARGSLPSLDDRLDVAINEDGTLKAVAGQATNTDLQAILQARNVAINGNMEDWTLGGALAPDNFVLSGAAGTVARTGPAMGDTFTFGAGTYAAKLTRAGTNVKLLQSIISAGEMPAAAAIKGKKIGILVKGKTAISSHLRIIVDDGVLTSASSFHTGGGAAEDLTVVHTLSGSATKLEVYASVESSNGDAYVGGWTFVFSNLAPGLWLPLDGVQVANASRGGTLAVGAQVIPGPKNPAGLWTFGVAPIGAVFFSRQTADLTKNASVAVADLVGLAFPIAANEQWAWECTLFGISAAAADWRFTFTGPAAPTAVWFGSLTANDPPTTAGAANAFAAEVVAASVGGNEMILLRGHVRNGANAGTIQARMAQLTSNASNSIVFTDSYIKAWRIA